MLLTTTVVIRNNIVASLGDCKNERGEDMTDKTRQSSPKRNVPMISLTSALRSPGKLLHDADIRLSAGLVRALRSAGYELPIEAWAILNLLWEEDNLPQFEIGARIGKDRHQTSRLIDSLNQQRLVTRKSIDEDRRVKRIELTDTGRAAQTTLKGVATEYLESTFTGVTQEDFDGFIRCLQHIVDKLKPANEKKKLHEV
jgi:DNA-binding MarR family transcriptional regulator